MKTTFSICILLSLMLSCKKDYSCTCEISYDDGTHETNIWNINHVSENRAEDICDSEDGPFLYPTGYPVTTNYLSGSKSCELN